MKAKRVKKLDPAGPLAENAARIVRVRLRELRSFAPAALDPDASRDQHDMRIAAKRLRYVLEATEFCFGSAGRTARRRARDLQGVLGELHDCDVMLPRTAGHAESLRSADAAGVLERAGDADDLDPALSARARHRTAYRGLDVLAVHLGARRELLFERFVSLWNEQDRAGTWERLERAVERKLVEARERREAAERAAQAAEELEKAERAEREANERARRAAAELAEARRAGGE
jgi:CHAD domain